MNEIHFYDPRVGAHCALSNLHPRPMDHNGVHYATPEHAYQALKACPELRPWLMAAPTPELAAAAGDALLPAETVAHWERDHLEVMTSIVKAKFEQHADLRALLLDTGTARLVEWAPEDSEVGRYWGEFAGQGHNHLGKILMALRDQFSAQQFPEALQSR